MRQCKHDEGQTTMRYGEPKAASYHTCGPSTQSAYNELPHLLRVDARLNPRLGAKNRQKKRELHTNRDGSAALHVSQDPRKQ